MRDIDLNLLPALDALLAKRHVTHAADSLGISQSTMSGILARLRSQLDDPLLVRVGRVMTLTPRAVELQPEVRQILLSLRKIRAPQAKTDGKLKRHFSIMTSEFGLVLLLPGIFHKIITGYPDTTLDTVPIEQPVESIFNGEVDICITGDRIEGAAPRASDMVRTRTLMEEHYVAVADMGHPLSAVASLEEIGDFPRVSARFLQSDHDAEEAAIPGISSRFPPACRVPGFLAIAPMIVGTPAIGLLPARLAAHIASQHPIKIITITDPIGSVAIKMLWHMRFDKEASHEQLRMMITEEVRAMTAEPTITSAEA